MSFLVRNGDEVRLEDGWRATMTSGGWSILPGGAAGVLRQWGHAEDHSGVALAARVRQPRLTRLAPGETS